MAEITIPASDAGEFMAYLAAPGPETAPVVVVIQEIFGVNQVMRDICEGFAREGYLAVCPDLFWRQRPGVQLTDRTEAEWQEAFDLMRGLDMDRAVDDLWSTLNAARMLPGASGKVGAVGYCLGGKLAFLMAARSDVDCSVSYYAVGLENLLGEASSIRKPLLLHLAEEDRFTPKEALAKIIAGLSSNPMVTLHTYPGVDHAFAREGGAHFHRAAANLANGRTAAFLAATLMA